MKTVRFSFSLLISIALVWALNRNWTSVQLPALGRFLDPFHGFWQNAETPNQESTTLEIEGLKGEVTVYYDSMLIPHIFATNDDDLYFAQGYVTARHRLWQMDMQTRAGSGRLSEILGSGVLDYDRTQRRLGMVFAAQNALKAIEGNPVVLNTVNKYTEGINAYINTLNSKTIPFEYKLLNFEPEPWTNFNCAMLLKNMAQTLNMGEKDIEMTNMLRLFDKATIDLLFPDNENVGDPIVDRTNNWKFKPITLDTIPMAIPNELITIPANAKPDKNVGSNNWAVSGSRTATGAPLLCNDPHLNLSLPSIWYAIHLSAPGVNVMGASLPGAPNVISGFNDSIAWGVTNAQRDLVDFYKIKFKDGTRNEYFHDGQWRKSTKVLEKFSVKGGDDFYDTVTYTHHGPVTYDESFHGDYEKNHYAFRWIAHDQSNEPFTFYLLNRGKNHADYMAALDHFAGPAQNFVFASVAGDIAMRVQGKYPVRRPEEGKYVLDGTKGYSEWQAFIPNDQNVMDKNPARGFVSSANQYPADNTYPYYITGSSFEAYRNRRINQLLATLDSATVDDMKHLQFDTYNLKAAESLPYFLAQLDSTSFTAEEKKAWDVLKKWDYYNTKDAAGASYYEAWWDALRPIIWDELVVENVSLDFPTTYTTIKLLKEQPTLPFFDIKQTAEKETAKELLRQSFKAGVQDIEKWKKEHADQDPRWADFKDTIIRHLLRLDQLSVRVQHGGNHDIVNASTRTHGPSWRMVVSLEKTGVKAWGIYPGGQSGNPGSPYYSNMIERWGNGEYFSLPFTSADKLVSRSIMTSTFKPAQK